MCAKLPKHLSQQTQYFLPYQQLITGQVLAAKFWLARHNLPLCHN